MARIDIYEVNMKKRNGYEEDDDIVNSVRCLLEKAITARSLLPPQSILHVLPICMKAKIQT